MMFHTFWSCMSIWYGIRSYKHYGNKARCDRPDPSQSRPMQLHAYALCLSYGCPGLCWKTFQKLKGKNVAYSVMLLQKAALVDRWTRSQPLHINRMYLRVMHWVCEKGYLTSKTKWGPQVCKSTCAWLVGTFICHPVLHGFHIVRVSMIFWAPPSLAQVWVQNASWMLEACSQSVGPGHHIAGSV